MIVVKINNIILTKGDYFDLLIDGQVIGLGRVNSIETRTYSGRERVNAGYDMVLIINGTQACLLLEGIDEGKIHPWKIMDLIDNIGKSIS